MPAILPWAPTSTLYRHLCFIWVLSPRLFSQRRSLPSSASCCLWRHGVCKVTFLSSFRLAFKRCCIACFTIGGRRTHHLAAGKTLPTALSVLVELNGRALPALNFRRPGLWPL